MDKVTKSFGPLEAMENGLDSADGKRGATATSKKLFFKGLTAELDT